MRRPRRRCCRYSWGLSFRCSPRWSAGSCKRLPGESRYPVMRFSWGSSQERVRLLCVTLDAVRPVGASGGSFSTGSAGVVTLMASDWAPSPSWAHGQDCIVVAGLGLHGGVGVVRAGASGVGLNGRQAVCICSTEDPVSGYPRVLEVVPGQCQAVVLDLGGGKASGRCRWVVLHPLGGGSGPGAA